MSFLVTKGGPNILWMAAGCNYTRDELFNYVRDLNSGDFLELVMLKVLLLGVHYPPY